jgi:alpha-galactosidase
MDQFTFLTNFLDGDGAVVARVTSQTATDPWAQAGIMIRNDVSPQSPEVSLLLTPDKHITFRYRSAVSGPTDQTFETNSTMPEYLRLSRSGNLFSADFSKDGINWSQLGLSEKVSMNDAVLAGLAVTAHNDSLISTGTFANFLVVPGPQTGVPANLYNHWDNQRAFVWETTWPLPQLDVASHAPSPTMGWNSWQVVGDTPGPSEYLITNTANALVADGLAAAGFKTVTIDCTWIASGRGYRETNGDLIVDTNSWPNGMKAVADYVHAMGLRMGGYSDIGPVGYGNPPHVQVGMYPYYQQDADQFAAWGWDFIKIDDHGPGDFYAACQAIANNASGRSIVLSLSTPQVDRLQFGNRIANSYRVGNDITFNMGQAAWPSTLVEFDLDEDQWFAQAPGHWNDPDMLTIGLKGISDVEGRSQFNIWCLLGAPLIIGTDVRTHGTPYFAPLMTAATMHTLTNNEVIAVDQDSLGAVGRPAGNGTSVYAKPLGSFTSGQFAVLLLNRSETNQDITLNWSDLGLVKGPPQAVRDLWAHQDLQSLTGSFTGLNIPPHGSMMLKVAGSFDWNRPRTYEAESAYNTFSGTVHYVPRNPNFSSSAYVSGVGNGPANTLQFNGVAAPFNSIFRVDIFYACSSNCAAQLSVNGGDATSLSFLATGSDTNHVGVLTTHLALGTGTNALTFGNPSGPAPNFDKLVVSDDMQNQ